MCETSSLNLSVRTLLLTYYINHPTVRYVSKHLSWLIVWNIQLIMSVRLSLSVIKLLLTYYIQHSNCKICLSKLFSWLIVWNILLIMSVRFSLSVRKLTYKVSDCKICLSKHLSWLIVWSIKHILSVMQSLAFRKLLFTYYLKHPDCKISLSKYSIGLLCETSILILCISLSKRYSLLYKNVETKWYVCKNTWNILILLSIVIIINTHFEKWRV